MSSCAASEVSRGAVLHGLNEFLGWLVYRACTRPAGLVPLLRKPQNKADGQPCSYRIRNRVQVTWDFFFFAFCGRYYTLLKQADFDSCGAVILYNVDWEINFYVLLTVHPNIMIVFLTNLMHTFFISIHLLHSSTFFKLMVPCFIIQC